MRKGEHITTYTGMNFYIIDPRIEDISEVDIAHALSLTCRANGHFKYFYSIAQHSINCFNEAVAREYSKRVQLACLLHDGSEAYISDVTRPAKKHLPHYLEIESKIQNVVYEKFGLDDLTDEELSKVKEIDDTVLWYEFKNLHNVPMWSEQPDKYAEFDFEFRNMQDVEMEFLRILKLLTNEKIYTAVGIDGCKSGYIAVLINILGESSIKLIKTIDEILNIKADVYLIDMPIGFTNSGCDERACDKVIRKLLQPYRGSSVFSLPIRKAIYANSYEEANRINRELSGKGLSKQIWAITPKIKEVDRFILNNKSILYCFFESHPEVCFAELLGGPCKNYKKEPEGEMERINILKNYFNITKLLSENNFLKKDVARDDVIDAGVLAVTGLLGLINGFKTIPETPQKDIEGLEMKITVMKRGKISNV